MIPELLAPAGNSASLHAAVSAGADAVYLGVDRFNARRNADNFDYDTLAQACDYAHLRGASVYVTMNTIILPEEVAEAVECARQCYRSGVDAFIIQDLGLALEVRRKIPQARIHVSTQMNIHSADGIAACAELGASRVTLARELSLGEIGHLCSVASDFELEVETFAHGAICVCYSGQCLMSSMIGGRSANRGLCAQACRLPYQLIDLRDPSKELRSPGEHLLSPKDLCLIDRVADLRDAGVSSLKIEGRMKSPEYVQTVVAAYREALDALADDAKCGNAMHSSKDAHSKLESVFSRGFTTAYLDGNRSNSMMGYQRPNNRGQFIGRVKSVKNGTVSISCERPLVAGDLLEVWTRRSNVVLAVGDNCMRGSKTAILELPKDAGKVHPNDRVFRVRSAEAAFKDDAHEPRVPVCGEVFVKHDQPLRMRFWLAAPSEVEDPIGQVISNRLDAMIEGTAPVGYAEGVVVETARTKPITAEEVAEHVDRLGSTPFKLVSLQIDLDDGVGLGFSQLHNTRKDALENLKTSTLSMFGERNLQKVQKGASSAISGTVAKKSQTPVIAVLATNPECARAAKRSGAELIYVPALNYRRGQSETAGCLDRGVAQAGFPKKSIPVIPAVHHDPVGDSRESRIDFDPWNYAETGEPVMVASLGALYHASQIDAVPEVSWNLPVTNDESVEVVQAFGASRIWLSPELNLEQIKQLISHVPDYAPTEFGIKVHGAQQLMVTEHCELMSQGDCSESCPTCTRRRIPHALRDRKGYEFRVSSDVFGRSHIYNSVDLDIVPRMPELLRAGITAFMVDSTLMTAEQTAQAIGRLAKAMRMAQNDGNTVPKQPGTTSGHLFRGVQ